MIDEKKLIKDIILNAGIQFDMNFKIRPEHKFIESLNQYTELFRQGIINLVNNQPKVSEWIPCSDRLPEDRKEKMVYLSSNRITIAKYNEHILPHTGSPIGWGYIPKNGYIDFENETVIAWMPLPEPYKHE